MNPIVPIIFIAVTLIGGGTAFSLFKTDKVKNLSTGSEQAANEIINVKDIKDKYLYTRDGQVIIYIKINPISIDLLSEREKINLTRTLTAEISGEQKPFKFIAVSRPVDISPLINEYTALIAGTSDRIQKELLRNEMLVMNNYALSGEAVERQHYIMLWETFGEGAERELSKRCNELASKFESCKIRCEILKQQDIVRLCNLINNPAYVHLEDSSFEAAIPLLREEAGRFG